MARVIVIGDGPGGLSAALFLAKNGQSVKVFGTDKTAMNYAHLFNYLGILEISGTDFQKVARQQVESYGAELIQEEVTSLVINGLFVANSESGSHEADYLVLTEGKNPELARSLGLDRDESGAVVVDRDNRSSVDRVYVVGRSVRPNRSQAIISAGAGAVAALDILAREADEDIQDWDSQPRE